LPITGYGEVNFLVTEMAMFYFDNGEIILKAIAPEIDLEYLKKFTDVEFKVCDNIKTMID
jgi:acyl CoA:acetate/3-ketoacid CoA transferase beta subunit